MAWLWAIAVGATLTWAPLARANPPAPIPVVRPIATPGPIAQPVVQPVPPPVEPPPPKTWECGPCGMG